MTPASDFSFYYRIYLHLSNTYSMKFGTDKVCKCWLKVHKTIFVESRTGTVNE